MLLRCPTSSYPLEFVFCTQRVTPWLHHQLQQNSDVRITARGNGRGALDEAGIFSFE